MREVILNDQGKEVMLNEMELAMAEIVQRDFRRRFKPLINSLGFEVSITTLTTIMKKITTQKFFHIAPSDFLPLRVGEGAWSTNLVTYLSYQLGDDFATGILNLGGNNARLAMADAGVSSQSIKVINWGKQIGWNIIELSIAAKAGNWDLVSAKEVARKTEWDLGIQKVAFLGLASGDSTAYGLYTQPNVTIDSTTLVQPISTLSTVELKEFVANILNVYRSNAQRTAWPTHFILPESDFLGLAAPSSADFPLKATMAVLMETFQVMTGNKDFKILPNAYGDKAYSGQTFQQYILLNYDEESVRMDIPVDYTNTLANSIDNFSFQNVGYGQFTGVLAYRPAEMYYLQFTP